MTKNDCKNIGYAFCGILGLIVTIVAIMAWVEYASNLDISEIQCYVNKVDFPQALNNNTYNHMWAECDCGRHCWAETPVANIYVQLHDDEDNVRTKYINNKKDKDFKVSFSVPREELMHVSDHEKKQHESFINEMINPLWKKII